MNLQPEEGLSLVNAGVDDYEQLEMPRTAESARQSVDNTTIGRNILPSSEPKSKSDRRRDCWAVANVCLWGVQMLLIITCWSTTLTVVNSISHHHKLFAMAVTPLCFEGVAIVAQLVFAADLIPKGWRWQLGIVGIGAVSTSIAAVLQIVGGFQPDLTGQKFQLLVAGGFAAASTLLAAAQMAVAFLSDRKGKK